MSVKLGLSDLIKPLEEVTLPSGAKVTPRVFNAVAYDQYRKLQQAISDATLSGESVDSNATIRDLMDEVLTHVLSDVTADDRASIGDRTVFKLAVIASAAGRLDEVLQFIQPATDPKVGAAEAPLSPPGTTSETP